MKQLKQKKLALLMQMCYLFMETNGATLPSGSVRDSFGIRSG